MPRPLLFRLAPLALTLAAYQPLAACQPAPAPLPGFDLKSAWIPQALEGDCSADNGATEFTDEISSIRAVVTGPGIDEPISAEGDVGSLTIDSIPIGQDRRVTVFGSNQNGARTWRSVRDGINVEQDTNTVAELLMARIADFSCPRNLQHRARAFHTATQLQNGNVLLVGGAESEGDCAGASCLNAGQFAEIYNPNTGSHTAVAAAMNEPRMFHTATLLPDGRVLIAGGASDAEIVPVDAQNPFPIRITRAVSTIEIFDPSDESFSLVGSDPGGSRAFHAATLLTLGNDVFVLISGGIDGLNAAGPNDLSNAFYSTTRCTTSGTIACEDFNAMVKPRAGHMSFTLDSGQVVMWGGAVETSDVGGVSGWQLEWFQPGTTGFELISTPGAPNAERNLFFAAFSQYIGFRVLAAGGLWRNVDGTFEMATIDGAGEAAAVYAFEGSNIFRFDPENQDPNSPEFREPTFGGIAVAKPSQAPMALSSPRFFAAAAALPSFSIVEDGTARTVRRVVIAGGFSSINLAPSGALSIYNEFALTTSPLSVGGQPRTLRQARGGLTIVGIGDGTVLFSGGEGGLGMTRTPLATGEIFADPEDPAEPAR